MKTEVLEWTPFIHGQVIVRNPAPVLGVIGRTVSSMYIIFIPEQAFAETASGANRGSWTRLFEKVLEIADYVDGGLIIYAGYVLMFGNRTRATELIFGSSIGYIIIRHWKDIQDFLKGF